MKSHTRIPEDEDLFKHGGRVQIPVNSERQCCWRSRAMDQSQVEILRAEHDLRSLVAQLLSINIIDPNHPSLGDDVPIRDYVIRGVVHEKACSRTLPSLGSWNNHMHDGACVPPMAKCQTQRNFGYAFQRVIFFAAAGKAYSVTSSVEKNNRFVREPLDNPVYESDVAVGQRGLDLTYAHLVIRVRLRVEIARDS